MRLQQIAVLAQMLLVHVEAGNPKFVYAGSCGTDFDGICSFESTSCEKDITFLDTEQTTQNGHSSKCNFRAKTDKVKLGFCGGDSPAFCTSVKENCEEEGGFVPNHSTCTIKSKSSRFGSCKNDSRCVWGPDDCKKNSHFIPAHKKEKECKASDVQTGVCVLSKTTFCAVSSDGCNNRVFKSITELLSDKEDVDCFLTPPEYVEKPTDPTPELPKSFEENSERMCDLHGVIDFSKEEDDCDQKCVDEDSCEAYQVTPGVGCTLFSGKSTFGSGDKFIDFQCWIKKGKKKSTDKICDPRGIIYMEKGLKNVKKCRQICKRKKELGCKHYMFVNNKSCLLFGKKGTKTTSSKKLMKEFTCYTRQ